MDSSPLCLRAIGSRKNLLHHGYYSHVRDLLETDEVQKLRNFRHHIMTTRFQHSLNVSYYTYLLCRLLHLNAHSAARAGMLHDLYFYETKAYVHGKPEIRHSRFHPAEALSNASKLVQINALEQDMIAKHMWPVTPELPQYTETFLITLVDKYCAVLEFLLPQPSKLAAWLLGRHRIKKA